MRIRLMSALFLLPLFGCEGGLDAGANPREQADQSEQGWWWWWGTPDEEEEEEEEDPTPSEPGDPDWFDAHCADGLCVVSDDFDPRDYLEHAQELCRVEMGLEEPPRFDLLWFVTERNYADEFRASDAHWTYSFAIPDPEDLWGYTRLECEVDVNGRTIDLGTGFASDSRMSVEIDALQQGLVYGIDYALEEAGSWSQINRGGFQWRFGRDAPELFLSDDEYNDWDSWNATTGEAY